MSELSPQMRALLEQARRSHGPSEDDRDRVLAGLHVSLGIAGALPVLTDASSASAGVEAPVHSISHVSPIPQPIAPPAMLQPAASNALGWSKLAAWKAGKMYLAALVLAGGGAASVTVMQRGDHDEHTRRSAAMVAPHEELAPVALAAAEAPSVEAPAVEQPVQAEVVPPASEVRRSARAEARSLRAVKASSSSRVSRAHGRRESHRQVREHHTGQVAQVAQLEQVRAESELLAQDVAPPAAVEPEVAPEPKPAESVTLGVASRSSPELALIRAALTSLRDRDSQQALRLLDEHAARYPNGAFGTERRALHVVALCAAGRTEEGVRERTQFLKTSGSSPIAARVRSACPR